MPPDRFQPNEEFAELIEFRQRVIDDVRPVLDRRLLRFVDENRPLTRPALVRQGFESAEDAILLADRARDLEVLSLEPSKAFIASALMLVGSSIHEPDLKAGIASKRRVEGQLLDQDEKAFLIQAGRDGDAGALDQLVFFYQPLIARIAYDIKVKLYFMDVDVDDLIQTGRTQLVTLVGSFDPTRASFGTYINKLLYWHMMTAASRDRKGQRRLNITQVSLSAPVGRDGSLTYEDLIPDSESRRPDHQMLGMDLRGRLDRAIDDSGLTKDERLALRRCYLEGYTPKDVGRKLGLPKPRVMRLMESAIRKIAKGPYASELQKLLY